MATVRGARPDDLDVLVDFNLAMAAESEDKGLDVETLRAGVRAALADGTLGRYFIAELDGRVAGALMVTLEWSDWRNGRFWWIQSVYVDPALRRRGVYTALHEHVRRLAREDPDACGIRLYVERENIGAMQTYDAMGMEETHYRLYEEAFAPDH